jgi:hypothetical protein
MRRSWIAGSLVIGAIGCASAPSPAPPSAAVAQPAAAPAPPAASEPAPPPTDAAPKAPASYLPSKDAAGSPFAGGDGTSADQAVIVLAETEDEGIDLEHHWTFDHYGRFRKVRGGLAAADGKHFDVITVELADHSEKTIYFDITAFYGVLEKPSPPPPP